MSDKQQFNIYLPKDLVKATKHAAVDNGQSLSVFVEQALRSYLKQLEAEAGQKGDEKS